MLVKMAIVSATVFIITILFNLTSGSESTLPTIKLVWEQQYCDMGRCYTFDIHDQNGTLILLENQPVKIQISSSEPLIKLKCSSALDGTEFFERYLNQTCGSECYEAQIDKAAPEMDDIWNCRVQIDGTEFLSSPFPVDVQRQETASYQGTSNADTPSNQDASNADTPSNQDASTEGPEPATDNRDTIIMIVSSVLIVVAIVLGVFGGMLVLRQKKIQKNRKLSVIYNQRQSTTLDHVYESINYDSINVQRTEPDLNKRPPQPLPSEPSEENQYHYDSPYDWRIDVPAM